MVREKLKPELKSHGFEELFENGLKRELGRIHESPQDGDILNLGCGGYKLDRSEEVTGKHLFDLQPPEWTAPYLNWSDRSVAAIHAYHFLEHLDSADLKQMMFECGRVLKIGGVMNICVPYSRSDIAFQDVDHKSFFTEESWRTLLANQYYDTMYGKQIAEFDITTNFIAGVVGRNLAVFTQLVKRGDS